MILRKETNLYDDDAISEALLQTVSNIFYDENMFNILTHNGAIQGLFWDNGQIYANMNYLRSGTIKVGGNGNINGLLEVYNASQTVTCRLNNTGLYAIAGTIGGMTLANNNLHNGMTSLSDTSHDGVYVGTDGIALGKGKFKATNAGAVTAANLTITGGSINGASITLGGSNNTSGVLRVNNASGTQIGSWDYTGLTASGALTMTYGGSSAQYKTLTASFSVLRYLGSSVVQDTLYGLKSSLSQSGTEQSYYCICPNVSILDVYTYTKAYNMEILYGTSSSGWHFDHHVDGSYFSMVRKNNSSTKTYKEFDFWIYGSTTTTADFRFYDGTFKVENGSITYNNRTVQFVGSSSVRYKNSITDKIDKKLDAHALYSLTMKQFVYNDDFDHLQYDDMKGKTLPGFIAEDVDKIYPAAVIHDDDGNIESWDERRIIPGMLALIQEQKKKIDKLEETVNKFKQVIHVA